MAKRNAAETAVALSPAEADVQIIEAQDKELAPYLDGKPYNEERLIEELEFLNKVHMNSAYEMGRRLLVLKATIPHGQFRSAVLDRVQIDGPHASRLMAFARTVVEMSAASKGMLDFEQLKSMDYRKVEALKSVYEKDLSDLEATGKIGGRDLDDWDGMSRSQLLQEVRKQKDSLEMRRAQLEKSREQFAEQVEINKQITAGTSNAVTESLTRLGKHLREALTDFTNTAVFDGELPEATAHDMRTMKAELRQFYHRINEIMENRFPDIDEVPSDVDLGEFPIITEEPAPTRPRKTAKVVDAN